MYSRILMQATSGKYKASLVWVGRDHKTEVKFIWIELIECTDLLIAEASDDAENITSKPHDLRTLETTPAQQKEKA